MFVCVVVDKLLVLYSHRIKYFTKLFNPMYSKKQINKGYKNQVEIKKFSGFFISNTIFKNYNIRTGHFLWLSLLGSLSGIFETLYLFIIKLSNFRAICLNGDCEAVLNSMFSSLAGIPIVIPANVLYFCTYIIFWKELFEFKNYEKTTLPAENYLTFVFCFIMFFFSLYFFFSLKFFFQANCFWCTFSVFNISLISFYRLLSKNGKKKTNLNFTINFVLILFFFITVCSFFLNTLELLG